MQRSHNVIASAAKQSSSHHLLGAMDCFAALAMTDERATTKTLSASFRGVRQHEPGISLNDLEVPDRPALRPVRNDAHKNGG